MVPETVDVSMGLKEVLLHNKEVDRLKSKQREERAAGSDKRRALASCEMVASRSIEVDFPQTYWEFRLDFGVARSHCRQEILLLRHRFLCYLEATFPEWK